MSVVKIRTGFTLVEIMVAVSIFVIVAMIITGAMLTLTRVNQKARALKLVMDNLNFALDSMALKMRQGGGYHCLPDYQITPTPPPDGYTPDPCSDGGDGVYFEAGDGGLQYIYQFNKDSGNIEYWASNFNDPRFTVLNRHDLDIENLRFYVFNGRSSPPSWPKVIISLWGQTTAGGSVTQFGLENTVSSR